MDKYFGNSTVNILRSNWNHINPKDIELVWNRNFHVPTADLLTSYGFGHSFNIAPSHELFDELR